MHIPEKIRRMGESCLSAIAGAVYISLYRKEQAPFKDFTQDQNSSPHTGPEHKTQPHTGKEAVVNWQNHYLKP